MSEAARQFRALLTRRFGWRLDEDRGEVERLLAARRGGRSELEYVQALADTPPSGQEFREIAEALAVSETYFFRNPEQFAALAEVALPAVAARGKTIRILSAGAASGEEAYSIAMTVLQVRKGRPLPPVEILGVDVSRRAIARARRGLYSQWALRALPSPVADEFFLRESRYFRVRPDVAAMARFEEGNVLGIGRIAPGPWDIVFFRNTFMYFTTEVARQIFGQVAGLMPAGAFLFLGHAETLRGVSDVFVLRHSHQTFYYQREPVGGERLTELPAAPPTPALSPPPPPTLADADPEWFRDIARASARIATIVDGRGDAPPAPAEAAPRKTPAAPLTSALALLAQERFDEALAAAGDGIEPERLLLRAVLLANMGRIDDARTAASAVLAADGTQAGAHYVLALCAERRRDPATAVSHDEIAAHLDETFAMPHLHLAMLASRRGDRTAARRHATHARRLFAAEDDVRILLFGGGFSRQALLQLCDAHVGARTA